MTMQLETVPPLSSPRMGSGRGTTHSVNRAIALLDALGEAGVEQTLTQLSEATGLSKSTALRLLQTLQNGGIIARNGSLYSIGHRVPEIALARPDRLTSVREQLREAAIPFLQELYELSRETVNLAVLSGTEALLLDRVFGHRRVMSQAKIAGRLSGTNSAVGKALLAHTDLRRAEFAIRNHDRPTPASERSPHAILRQLSIIRQSGVAFDREENSVGVSCAAAPIFIDGRCVAAVSISGSVTRCDVGDFAHAVVRAASNISKAAGARVTDIEYIDASA